MNSNSWVKVEAKKKKKDKGKNGVEEEVLFSIDSLSKIISYLPSIDVLNLALTCKRFGVSNTNDDSIIKESVRIAIKEIASEDQLLTLSKYKGVNSLADYDYVQFLRGPLTFDRLAEGSEYVDKKDKSFVRKGTSLVNGVLYQYGTAFSNNILWTGKHYAIFENINNNRYYNGLFLGVCKEVNGHVSSDVSRSPWEMFDSIFTGEEIGILLDLDEGTLSMYKNGRKTGDIKRGLVGPYCWAVSMLNGMQVSIKRGAVPP